MGLMQKFNLDTLKGGLKIRLHKKLKFHLQGDSGQTVILWLNITDRQKSLDVIW